MCAYFNVHTKHTVNTHGHIIQGQVFNAHIFKKCVSFYLEGISHGLHPCCLHFSSSESNSICLRLCQLCVSLFWLHTKSFKVQDTLLFIFVTLVIPGACSTYAIKESVFSEKIKLENNRLGRPVGKISCYHGVMLEPHKDLLSFSHGKNNMTQSCMLLFLRWDTEYGTDGWVQISILEKASLGFMTGAKNASVLSDSIWMVCLDTSLL